MNEIPVRCVQLDGIEANPDRTLCGFDEVITHALHIRRGHLARHRPGGAKGDGRRSDGLPGIRIGCERLASLPWPARGGFTAGVRQLDTDLGSAVATAMSEHPRQRRLAVVR